MSLATRYAPTSQPSKIPLLVHDKLRRSVLSLLPVNWNPGRTFRQHSNENVLRTEIRSRLRLWHLMLSVKPMSCGLSHRPSCGFSSEAHNQVGRQPADAMRRIGLSDRQAVSMRPCSRGLQLESTDYGKQEYPGAALSASQCQNDDALRLRKSPRLGQLRSRAFRGCRLSSSRKAFRTGFPKNLAPPGVCPFAAGRRRRLILRWFHRRADGGVCTVPGFS